MGCSKPRSFNKTLSFINFIFALAATAVLMAQDTSATVSGTVRNPGFGIDPPIDAELDLLGAPHTLFTVQADDYGNFKFSVLPPGRYTLTLTRFGHGLGRLKVEGIRVGNGEEIHLPPLRLHPAGSLGPPAPKFIELRPSQQSVGNLIGLVIRSEHHPIARATVKLLCDDKICGETKSGANGEFVFFNLLPRNDYRIRVKHAGFYPVEESDFEVKAGFDSTYWPIPLERCPNGDCDPRLRSKPTVTYQ
jgi:hypothetical protein